MRSHPSGGLLFPTLDGVFLSGTCRAGEFFSCFVFVLTIVLGQ